jgi:sulfatase maturation enzyme AslB (radical SAM superfamily)
MNLLITNRCNNTCSYCFLKDGLLPPEYDGGNISDKDFDTALDFAVEFARLGVKKNLNLLGGEPTLHPKFKKILVKSINSIKDRDSNCKELLPVNIFTNGIFDSDIAEFISEQRCGVMFNINNPSTYPDNEWNTINQNLQIISSNRNYEDNGITLSLNVHKTDQKIDYMFELAEQYNIKKLRVDIARPNPAKDNNYIPLDKIHTIIPELISIAEKCTKNGIQYISDCCLPVCSISNNQLKSFKENGVYLSFSCPGAFDVNYDLEFWYCLPMRNIKFGKLYDYENAHKLLIEVDKKTTPIRWNVHSKDGCDSCKWNTINICQGGCLPFKC